MDQSFMKERKNTAAGVIHVAADGHLHGSECTV